MSPQVFHLPDLGEGLTEAALVRWMVAVGDTITVDQAIAEVETAKSIVELPSPYAGTVLALHGEEGESILTGAPVIEVGSGGDGGSSPAADSSDDASPSAASPSTDEHEAYRQEEQAGSGNVLIGYGTGAGPAKGRRRRRGDADSQTTPVDRKAAASVAAPASAPAPAPIDAPLSGPVAVRSPIVRRLARELGIDPRTVTPSGSDGAVTRADVLRAAESGAATPGTAPAAPVDTSASQGNAVAAPRATGPLNVLRTEPFSPLRKAVSAKLSQSRAEIPEATVWVDVDLTELWQLRPQMAQPGEKPPSLTALFARYTLLALQQYPLLASRLNERADEITVFDGTSLGIAVDTPRGLMVPVIHRAEHLTVADLDGALRDLSRVAREGRTPPEQLRDSTFTLNNYGGFGVDGSAAIINHPEVALLGVGRVLERPWVVDGEIVARRIAQLSLVFDHRVCDGGYAAGFLRTVVDLLEHPLRAYPQI